MNARQLRNAINNVIPKGSICQGPKACGYRSYDSNQSDCKECRNEALDALAEADALIMADPKPAPLAYAPIPEDGHHMTTAEFYQCCMQTDSMGGKCFYATSGQVSNREIDVDLFTNIVDHPFTHVVWLNV